ncbi:hypothetical protein Bhyg_14671 [Pseudolycoriella hygida]|uniref:Uncharacterized protein n=1 Tax=Pseudolycoriella hygida TaxID=35572 RepID=A0A9Q0MR22_9DIPT|nr:hypothetical protein Bhyg_14671 [Pseudolycoriella hygida]
MDVGGACIANTYQCHVIVRKINQPNAVGITTPTDLHLIDSQIQSETLSELEQRVIEAEERAEDAENKKSPVTKASYPKALNTIYGNIQPQLQQTFQLRGIKFTSTINS